MVFREGNCFVILYLAKMHMCSCFSNVLLPCYPAFFLYTIYRVGSLAENEDMQGADMITVDTTG